MTITIWVVDVFNEMCAGIKERKCEPQWMTPKFPIISVGALGLIYFSVRI
jgi:hypothetical protein